MWVQTPVDTLIEIIGSAPAHRAEYASTSTFNSPAARQSAARNTRKRVTVDHNIDGIEPRIYIAALGHHCSDECVPVQLLQGGE